MKRLILVLAVVLLAVSVLQASVTTTIKAQTAGTPSYTKTYVKWTLSDTANIEEVFLYLRTGTAAFTIVDSLTPTALTDSILVDTLRNGITYDYYLELLDTTGNDSTYLSWNAWHYSFTTKNYAPHVKLSTNTTYLASNYTGFRVVIDTVGAKGVSYDSLWSKIVLQYGLTEATIGRWDSVTTTHAAGDSITVDSLVSGATYSYRIITTFKDGATTHMDTTAFGTATTRDYYPTITEVYFSNDTLILAYDTTTGHTMGGFKRTYLWLNTSYNNASRCWTKQDSIGVDAYEWPDSIWMDTSGVYANPKTIIGKRGLWYRYRFITIDSLAVNNKVTDTSATDSVYFPDYAFMNLPVGIGVPGAHVEKGKLYIDKTGDSPSTGYIPIAGYDYLQVKFKLTGQRDVKIPASGTCDSITFYIGCAGIEGDVKIDSIINRVTIDTSGLVCFSYDLADTARTNASLPNKFSDWLKIWGTIADSATFADSVLNRRIGNYEVILK